MPDSTPFAIALPFLVITLTLTAAAPIGWLLIFHAWLENRASSQAAAGLPPGAGGPAAPARSSGQPGQAAAAHRPRPGYHGRSGPAPIRPRQAAHRPGALTVSAAPASR